MTTTRALLLALSLTPALAACDERNKDDGDSTGTAGESSGTEGDGASDTGAEAMEEPCDEEAFASSRECATGVQYCARQFATDGTPRYFWGACVAEPMCTPGVDIDACTTCELDETGVPMENDICGEGGTTPLVLRFDEPVRFASSAADFDLGPQCGATDWLDAATPWLALDRDGSGTIDGGHELFGSATALLAGGTAENGFVALAELDRDGDGTISAADPDFARLLLWADHDADRRSTAWELDPAASAGLVSIELGYRSDRQCDARGNCEIERAAFTYRDRLGRVRTGEVIDVHLACQ